MLKLYRGIVDILTERSEGLTLAFRGHIREFNDGDTNDNNFGVKGFWNLLLEITYVMYVKLFVAVGVVLTLGLAVVFFPLYALTMAVSNIMNHRASFDPEYIEPTVEKK
jgi:preprotein translocase subunit SecG